MGVLVTLEGLTREKCVLMKREKIITRHRLRSCKWSRRALVKRRPKHLEASRRSCNAIQRRLKTLKHLIPNSTKSEGLDGLFRDTAEYILTLQMKVRVMQTMVQVLTEPNCV